MERWDALRDALMAHAASHDVARVMSSPYGTKYLIEGSLQTPDGRNPGVRSVWIIDTGTDVTRLVSAYALKRQRGSNGTRKREQNG